MELAGLLVALGLCAAPAESPPEYSDDPFGDADFRSVPLVLDATPRFEGALLFTNSLIDRYNSHVGALVDLSYGFTNTLGIALSVGYLHGTLTQIVTDPTGVLGNKVARCRANPQARCDLQPNVPDYRQLTGLAEAMAVWTPLAGKISLVSEVDLNLRAYALLGAGINGTRQVKVALSDTAAAGYRLSNSRWGDGGMFRHARGNGTFGVGLKLFLRDWLALRAELRGLVLRDRFDFDQDGTPEPYTSVRWLGQVGLGFAP